MPIYAPSLPPRPELSQGNPPILVFLRFDFKRLRSQKIGMFFGFGITIMLIVQEAMLYFKHLSSLSSSMAPVGMINQVFFPQGPDYQAGLVTMWGGLTGLIWILMSIVGGGLVARDTLYRIRPLIYAHPVKPLDYLSAKGLFAAGLPFCIMLPFIVLPWGLSLAIAGLNGPVWPTLPIFLVPAALIIALLMGVVSLGTSSLASTPRAGFGWMLGVLMGTWAIGGILTGALSEPSWLAISPWVLVTAWPELLCRVPDPTLGWIPTLLGTAAHLIVWSWIAVKRTLPSEAVI